MRSELTASPGWSRATFTIAAVWKPAGRARPALSATWRALGSIPGTVPPRGRAAPGPLRAVRRVGQHLGHRAAAGQSGDEPVSQLSREGLGLGAEPRDVDRDRVVQVDEAVLSHLEADGTRLAVERVVDLLAAEQGPHGLHVLAERGPAHRLLGQRGPTGRA